jgi:hypothetical protein
VFHRSLGEAQVALALGDRRHHGMRHQPRQHDVELRPVLQELPDEARQEAVGERRQGCDAQKAGAPGAQLGRHLLDALQPDERPLDLGVERQRLAGRHQPGAAALEQHQAEVALQVADQAADRGLGDVDQRSGRADAAGEDDGPELPRSGGDWDQRMGLYNILLCSGRKNRI